MNWFFLPTLILIKQNKESIVFFFFTEKEIKDAFERGKRAGYEEGKKDAFAQIFESTEGLAKEEEEGVIRFLQERGLSIAYDIRKGGLRLRKKPNTKFFTESDVINGLSLNDINLKF